MKTVGLDAVLSALKGDSAPITSDRSAIGEGGAFNTAFETAARNAAEKPPSGGNSNASSNALSTAHESPLAGNLLPNGGKELPISASSDVVEAVTPDGATIDSASISALAPSPFMKAALDKAVSETAASQVAAALGKDAGSAIRQGAQSIPIGVSLPSSISAAPRLLDQEVVAASQRALHGSVDTPKDHHSPLMPRPTSATTVKPALTNQIPATAPNSDMGIALNPTPEGSSVSAAGAATPKNSLAGTGPDTDQPVPRNNGSSPVTNTGSAGVSNGVGNMSSAARVSSNGGSELTNVAPGESFDALLDSNAVRAAGLREGTRAGAEGRAHTVDSPINSLAGLNPTVRSAEVSSASVITQVPGFKASPDSANFPQEVVTRVRMIQGQGGTEARLNLHPAELGRLQIAITSEGDATRVAFVVDNAQAKEALEQAMPRLREFLQQAGLQLAEGSVSQQGQQDRAGFAQSEAHPDDGRSANAHDAEEDRVINGKSDRGSDPRRMLDAYA